MHRMTARNTIMLRGRHRGDAPVYSKEGGNCGGNSVHSRHARLDAPNQIRALSPLNARGLDWIDMDSRKPNGEHWELIGSRKSKRVICKSIVLWESASNASIGFAQEERREDAGLNE